MITIPIKALSVNDAWTGRRFKSPKYKKYEADVCFMLPNIEVPAAPLKIKIEVGFSSKGSDLDNCLKEFIDCLSKKYHFNDNQINELHAYKKIVEKGKEYISFNIASV